MKQHNIVIAGRTDMIETLNQLANQLRGSARLMYGGAKPLVSVVTDMEAVKDYVEDGDVTALIISESISSIETGSDITISQSYIKDWKENHPDMLVVLVVDATKKGGVKLKKLFEEGYFNVLYFSDYKQHKVIDILLANGREEADAFKYYGLDQNGMYEAPPKTQQSEPAAPIEEVEEDGYEEKRRPPRAERPRKKKNYNYHPMEEDDDLQPRHPRFESTPIVKPSKRRDEEYDDYEDYEDYEDPEDDYREDEEEIEEEVRRTPTRSSRRSRRSKKTVIYPLPDDCRLILGNVIDIDEDENLIVQIPVQDGITAVLDDSFIGTQVVIAVSTEEG